MLPSNQGKSLVEARPDLVKEWDYERNSLGPENFPPSSNKKMWWKCLLNPCGCHRWQTTINNRTKDKGNNCPYCAVPCKKMCPHNNLRVVYPELCKEWHPKNTVKPSELAPASSKKVWWKCSKDPCGCHEWEAAIGSRTVGGHGCPYCAHQKCCKHYNLQSLHPELCLQWSAKNKKGPEQYVPMSTASVWWKCPQDPCGCHEWRATISGRVLSAFRRCPFCYNRRLCEHNNLKARHPELCQQWSSRNGKGPDCYPPASGEEVWWKCDKLNCEGSCLHEWRAKILNRTLGGKGCPYCSGRVGCKCKSFVLKLPKLALEWNIDKNGPIPETMLPQCGKSVWWICAENNAHQWRASVQNRSLGTGCSACCNKQYSKMQIRWLDTLAKEQGINIQHALNGGEYKLPSIGKVDGYCEATNTVYEAHGCFWHGCLQCEYPQDESHPVRKSKTYGELYQTTLERDDKIRSLGHTLVVVWEHELNSKG